MAVSTDSVPGVPIVIGVTGHRDLRPEDIPHLASAVRRVFEKLRAVRPAPGDGVRRLIRPITLTGGR